mmetsp:Transcript_44315/g.69298  ORF Transcript_44315/g.69298 Transcript_44315/m.69298 type:complete len:204 (+) Transcript_44315:265-876(+)
MLQCRDSVPLPGKPPGQFKPAHPVEGTVGFNDRCSKDRLPFDLEWQSWHPEMKVLFNKCAWEIRDYNSELVKRVFAEKENVKAAKENCRNFLFFLGKSESRDEFKSVLKESAPPFAHIYVANCTSNHQSRSFRQCQELRARFRRGLVETIDDRCSEHRPVVHTSKQGGLARFEQRMLCTQALAFVRTKVSSIMSTSWLCSAAA